VHDRRLTRPPEVDCPHRFARRIRFGAEVVGPSIFDRLLRRFVGRQVEISITCWGGPLILVTGYFQRAESYIMIAAQPIDANRTLTEVIVFGRKRQSAPARLLEPIGLRVRRRFTKAFMRNDIDRLQGIRYNPAALVPSDQLMRDFFAWLTALPGGEGATRQATSDAACNAGVKFASSTPHAGVTAAPHRQRNPHASF